MTSRLQRLLTSFVSWRGRSQLRWSAEDLELLNKYANESVSGMWLIGDGWYQHTTEAALTIIKSCLILDVEVTDIVTAEAWYKIIMKISALEARVEALVLGSNDD